MSIVKERFWTLERKGNIIHLRQYETSTKLMGDEAHHKGIAKLKTLVGGLHMLPSFMILEDIQEFGTEENASWLMMQPVDL